MLTDNGMAFADLPKYRDGPTAKWMGHIFDRVCRENGIAVYADPRNAGEVGRHNTLSGYLYAAVRNHALNQRARAKTEGRWRQAKTLEALYSPVEMPSNAPVACCGRGKGAGSLMAPC